MPTTSASETGPRTPEGLMRRFSQYVSEADLDQLVALYAPDALFVPQPGVQHRGRAAIRGALAALLELSPQMEARVAEVHLAGDTALVVVDWSLNGTAPDGSAVIQNGRSADVLRRDSDGAWKVLIDHP